MSERVIKALMSGKSHIQDVPSDELAKLVKSGKFEATTDEARMQEMDAISIAVPTPLAKTRDPDMGYVLAAADAIGRNCRPGLVVVLESTTYPGTTRELMQPKLEAAGLTVGEDVFLAFSPERVDPGNPTWNTKNTPKIVGGITAGLHRSRDRALRDVSGHDRSRVEHRDRRAGEAAREHLPLGEHRPGQRDGDRLRQARRQHLGSDRRRGDEAVRLHEVHTRPGIGGHCIPLDPHYLAWKMRTLNYKTRFIDLASEINSEMPALVVRKVAQALNEEKKAVNGSRMLVLGVAYKKDIDDMRESPALDVIRLLEQQGANVVYHDPHVPKFREDGHEHASVPLTDEELDPGRCGGDRHRSLERRLSASRRTWRRVVVDTQERHGQAFRRQEPRRYTCCPGAYAVA